MSVKKSFRLKLTISYVSVILLSFGLIAFFLDKNLEENSLQDIKKSLLTQARIIENQLEPEYFQKNNTGYLNEMVTALSQQINCRLTIIDVLGTVLADSQKVQKEVLKMENHLRRPEVQSALNTGSGIDTRYSSTLKMDMLYVALAVKEHNEILGFLRLALPLESVQEILFTVRKTVLLGLIFALGLAFVLGSVISSSMIKPINRIIIASRRFSQGDFRHRIYLDSQDEIAELGNTLNKMAQDIENKIKEVSRQNQHLSVVFNSMIEGVVLVDKNARIISLNRAVEKIFGIPAQKQSGRLFLEAIPNNDISEVINNVLEKKEFVSQELILNWPVQKIFQVNAAPILDKDGVSGCLAVIHDITKVRELETIRRDFVANVSHELKTPLTSIKGFVETLLEGALDDKENSRNFLKIIQEHAKRLDDLVNDLLDLSHIESGEIKLELKDFNLTELADEIFSRFKSGLKKKSIAAVNNLPQKFIVRADKKRIEQVLVNLIDNAIKFNREKGTIKIYGFDSDGKANIGVEDSGIGISAKDIPRIFERFYRVDKTRSRELGGTGLGLSIVKHIVELHSGSVGVESTEGLGSKFWFTLPQ